MHFFVYHLYQFPIHDSRTRSLNFFNLFTEYVTNESSIKFVRSLRGNPLILLQGFKFYKYRTIGLKSRWQCSTHNSKGCTAFVHTIDDEIIKVKNDHNHPPVSSDVSYN